MNKEENNPHNVFSNGGSAPVLNLFFVENGSQLYESYFLPSSKSFQFPHSSKNSSELSKFVP